MHILRNLGLVLFAFFSLRFSGMERQRSEANRATHPVTNYQSTKFVITAFGAKTSASAKVNQDAINRAIATASKKGGGEVIVPKGTWNTGAIRLQSHVNLVISDGATLKFAFDPKLYPLVKTSWEGMGCWNYSPCIYAYRATDVALTGTGTVDGNGSNDTWWPWNGNPFRI